MFFNCYSLTSLDLSSFTNDKIIYTEGMFFNSSNLMYIDIRRFNISKNKFEEMLFGMPDNKGTLVINSYVKDIIEKLIPQNWSIEVINMTLF